MFMGAVTNKEMASAIREVRNNRKLQPMQRKTQRDDTHSLRSSISSQPATAKASGAG